MPEENSKITVSVTLRSILAKFRPDPKNREPFPVQLDAGATVGDLIAKLRVSDKLARLIFVNHVRCDYDAVLPDGANIDVFPPIAGG
jgi:molybdopterin converting factor small subunit